MRITYHNGPYRVKASSLSDGAVFQYDGGGILLRRPMLVMKCPLGYVELEQGSSVWTRIPGDGGYAPAAFMDECEVVPVDTTIHVHKRVLL